MEEGEALHILHIYFPLFILTGLHFWKNRLETFDISISFAFYFDIFAVAFLTLPPLYTCLHLW